MTTHAGVYDLDEISTTARPASAAQWAHPLATPRAAHPTPARPDLAAGSTWAAVHATLTRTLPLFATGTGQFLRRDAQRGVLFLSWILLCAALAWSTLVCFERLVATLTVFGLSSAIVFAFLASLYVLAGIVHLTSVLSAVRPGDPAAPRPHPSIAGAASLLLPGWGQLLSGHRVRAGLLLGTLWLLGGCWLFFSPAATEMLNVFLPGVHPLEMTLRQPAFQWTVRFTLPLLLWSLAVYDATAAAAWERRGSAARG